MIDEGELLAGRYRLVLQVGTGAMGVVWKAHDEYLNRVVAVKQLLQTGLLGVDAEEANRRAMREARIAARLHHPHAIVVYDVLAHDGTPYLIMEYLHSQSLSTVLTERGPLPPAQVARIGSQIAAALAAAHEAGIVHRDIKPGNVLLASDGTAKITDFGISHAVGDCTVTATGVLIGTPAYLAPEVARGQDAGFPADVFALGSTLYAAVEGTPPFGVDENPLALLYRIVNNEIIPPTRSGPLTTMLSWLLDRDCACRPTMRQAQEALAATAVLPASGVPAPAGAAETTAFSPLPASGSFATPSPSGSTGAPTAKLALAREVPVLRPGAGSVTRPRRPMAVIAVAAASLFVVGLLLVATLINEGNNAAEPGAGAPSTTPAAPHSEQPRQHSSPVGGGAEAAPILAAIPEPAPVHSPGPSRVPSSEPGARPTSETSAVPTSETSAVPTPETSAVPTSETSAVPTPELDEVSSPEPTPVPEAGPQPSPSTDAANP